MALMVLCSADFFGVSDGGSRAKARNDAEFQNLNLILGQYLILGQQLCLQ
jgi:hypothetical protein